MKLENMFKKTRAVSGRKGYISLRERRPEVPEGLLRKCNKCGSAIIAEDVKRGYYICPKCGGYFRVHAYRRIEMITDDGTFEEWDKELVGENPMDYKGYPEKLAAVQEKTKLTEAVVTGKAEITKTPEPMRPIKPLGQGKFIAHYEKMAQPDYKGTLAGGRAVVFEAKHTDSDRLQRSVISSEQEKQLDRHEKLGAECFVMVSFGFEQYFKIPWGVFRDMKARYGRKYITPQDVQEYKVAYTGGVIHFI